MITGVMRKDIFKQFTNDVNFFRRELKFPLMGLPGIHIVYCLQQNLAMFINKYSCSQRFVFTFLYVCVFYAWAAIESIVFFLFYKQ